ncbi:lytic transglycosylase domain-containing protein [Novosphingobium gossypii]|uniref:lytic transglycosylase domain-containing protein n=1 Tax=Novosphingobium gossypii TaxID=1604774 RepID=UPI003D1FCDF2
MTKAACKAGLPVDLFDALIVQESRYNPAARSSKGASGLTQLMPGTATQLGVWDRWDIQENLDGGARYLRQQLDSFGNWALALSAYNAGPGNVRKHKGIPPFKETRQYVQKILASIAVDQRSSSRVLLPGRDPVTPPAASPGIQLIAFSP